MTTYTRAQLVTEAADCLTLIGSGQSLDDEDADKIDQMVDPLIDQLAADQIVDIDDLAEIPAKYFKALGELLGVACSTKFGMEYNPIKKQVFEAQIQKAASSRPTYETMKSEYY